jgi:hypothetical protein
VEKNPCKQKGFKKKYMHQTCLKCEKTYLKKQHTYTADNLEKNANINANISFYVLAKLDCCVLITGADISILTGRV